MYLKKKKRKRYFGRYTRTFFQVSINIREKRFIIFLLNGVMAFVRDLFKPVYELLHFQTDEGEGEGGR